MPSDDPARRLDDILENITRIRTYTEGMNEADFLSDGKTVDATERCLERIAEAARNLGGRFDADYPALNFPALRRFGSALRHDYDSIQPALLWGFIRDRLDSLEAMARSEIDKLPGKT